MIYGFCDKVLKNSYEYKSLYNIDSSLTEKELCIKTLYSLGLKYHLRIDYDVNVRVNGDNLNYYTTDMYFMSDKKTIDQDDELYLLTLTEDELRSMRISFYSIGTCGWNSLYSNDKDYYDLRNFDIDAYTRGGQTCRGD